MKVNSLITKPFKRLQREIGLTPQNLTVGDKVDVYDGITCKVSFSGIITSLYKDGSTVKGDIKEDSGKVHCGNGLGTTKLVDSMNILIEDVNKYKAYQHEIKMKIALAWPDIVEAEFRKGEESKIWYWLNAVCYWENGYATFEKGYKDNAGFRVTGDEGWTFIDFTTIVDLLTN